MGGVHGGGQSAMCTGLELLAICFRRAGSCHAVGRLPRSLWPSLVSASRPPALTLLRAWSAASLHRGGHPLSPLFRFVRLAWRRPVSLPPRSSLWRQGRDRRRGGCCSPPSLGIFLVADPMAGAVADSRCRPYKSARHWHFAPDYHVAVAAAGGVAAALPQRVPWGPFSPVAGHLLADSLSLTGGPVRRWGGGARSPPSALAWVPPVPCSDAPARAVDSHGGGGSGAGLLVAAAAVTVGAAVGGCLHPLLTSGLESRAAGWTLAAALGSRCRCGPSLPCVGGGGGGGGRCGVAGPSLMGRHGGVPVAPPGGVHRASMGAVGPASLGTRVSSAGGTAAGWCRAGQPGVARRGWDAAAAVSRRLAAGGAWGPRAGAWCAAALAGSYHPREKSQWSGLEEVAAPGPPLRCAPPRSCFFCCCFCSLFSSSVGASFLLS